MMILIRLLNQQLNFQIVLGNKYSCILNQGVVTANASHEPILKVAYLIAIFKREMAVVAVVNNPCSSVSGSLLAF